MLTVGDSADAGFTVQPSDTAQAAATAAGDAFPAVLASARMIGLMEVAAARLMRPLLQAGQLSVGVAFNIAHTAATPVGGNVRAVATYLGQEGKLYRFKVEAFDDAGSVGNGEHTRAIITTERLLNGAARRKQ